jgi:hypothetical protein
VCGARLVRGSRVGPTKMRGPHPSGPITFVMLCELVKVNYLKLAEVSQPLHTFLVGVSALGLIVCNRQASGSVLRMMRRPWNGYHKPLIQETAILIYGTFRENLSNVQESEDERLWQCQTPAPSRTNRQKSILRSEESPALSQLWLQNNKGLTKVDWVGNWISRFRSGNLPPLE